MKSLLLALTTAAIITSVARSETTHSLADAAETKRWDLVSEMVDRNSDLAPQPDGMTALHWAARWNEPIAVSRLVAGGADVDIENVYGVTPLAIACRLGHLNAAIALLDAGANPNQESNGRETMLMHAARVGSVSLARHLLDHGAVINAKQSSDQTALMWAAAAGHADVVELLVDRGAEWDAKLKSGFTALHFAARQGHADVIRRLLDAGADVNARMNPQNTGGRAPRKSMSPLMLAVESGHFELALRLVDWGADPNDQRSGYAPLHALSWVRKPPRGDNPAGDPPPVGSGDVGSLQFVRELVERGAEVNLRLERGKYAKAKLNHKGATPLLMAAHTGDLPYARLLVELGADVGLANEDGTTPMLAAAGVGIFVADEYPGTEQETLAMVNQIHEWGGKIDDVDKHGETVLHGAAYRSFAKVVDRLVDLGADPKQWHRENAMGSTPRQVAEGKRPGSFKPNKATIAAIDRALHAVGIKAKDWKRVEKKKDWNQ